MATSARLAYYYARALRQGQIKRPSRALVVQYKLEDLVRELGLTYYEPRSHEDLLHKKRAKAYAWQVRAGRILHPCPNLLKAYKLEGATPSLQLTNPPPGSAAAA